MSREERRAWCARGAIAARPRLGAWGLIAASVRRLLPRTIIPHTPRNNATRLSEELVGATAVARYVARLADHAASSSSAPSLYGGADASSASWDGDEGAREGRLRALLRECVEGVYAFPFLTDAACAMLVAEVDADAESGLPQARPNSMNKYGLVLNEVGMEALDDL